MIRPATHADVEQMVQLGALMHQESRFNVLAYAPDKVAHLIRSMIDDEQFVAVADVDGEIIGGFLGVAVEHWASRDLVASDYTLFIAPERRGSTIPLRLIRAFRSWAQAKGCKMISAGISTGVAVEKTAALYQAAGFERIGLIFEGAS